MGPAGDGETGGDGGGKTFNRSKLVCDCYPERSIRVSPKQAERGRSVADVCPDCSLPLRAHQHKAAAP